MKFTVDTSSMQAPPATEVEFDTVQELADWILALPPEPPYGYRSGVIIWPPDEKAHALSGEWRLEIYDTHRE